MKNTLTFLAVIVVISLMSSCGDDGSLAEVDLIPVWNGNDYLYIDREGRIAINPQFSQATVFREGKALVRTNGSSPQWGYIYEDGKYLINAQYKRATVFQEGLAWVVKENGAPAAIDQRGEVKFSLKGAHQVRLFSDGLAAYSVMDDSGNTRWGFVNKKGETVINPQFKAVADFSEGKCGVKNSNGQWGFIDKAGLIVINNQFDDVDRFRNGRCIVVADDQYGLINAEGKYVVNPQYKDMKADGKKYLVNMDGQWGWCDQEGNMLVNPQFSKAHPYQGNKLAAVRSGDRFGFIDREGRIAINPQFDEAWPLNGGLAMVRHSGKIGFIDDEGKYVINPQFTSVPEDLRTFYTHGGTEYQAVSSDFFNATSLIRVIDFDNPEGLPLNATFKDLMEKFDLDKRHFKKYKNSHEVFSDKKISADASYSFTVSGEAFQEVVKIISDWNGLYYDTSMNFNKYGKITEFAYTISLTSKNKQKTKAVLKALQGKLSGYKLVRTNQSRDNLKYSDGKKQVSLVSMSSNIYITITPLT